MKKYILKPTDPSTKSLPDGFETSLNAAQLEVVKHTNGPLLVIAGAGSGKTRTLVYRLVRLVHDGVPPPSILLLTFTRKASQEMMRRATGVLDSRCQNVAGGTFHSFANQILREFAQHLGYSNNFTIMDRSDADDLVGKARKAVGDLAKEKRFPKKRTIAEVISKSINMSRPVATILEREYPQFWEFAEIIDQIQMSYIQTKKTMQVMDYDDLLIQLKKLLMEHDEVRQILQTRYRYIMVDEYQDTNLVQSEIVHLLGDSHKNVMVVGDDSQSIYSFRGANFKNIMEFPQLFAGAKVINIEENYRSVQPILDLTNAVISKAKERYTKTLYSNRKSDSKPVFIETMSEHEQSRFIVQKVLELREEGIPLDEIAILFRSSMHANDMEVALKAADIPYVKYGGFKFTETAHIKDVVAICRLMFNLADGVSWTRALLLLEGIGPKMADTIYKLVQTHLTSFDQFPILQFKKKKFHFDLADMIRLIQTASELKVSVMLEQVLDFYAPILKTKHDDYHKRQQDLDSLKLIADRYDDLESFLTELSLEPPDGSQKDSAPDDGNDEHLILSTIHSSKGLEWHSVFILSMVDGYLPSFRSLGDITQIEEERRLLYVAMTRAKDNLFVMKPNIEPSGGSYFAYPGMSFSKMTRFLDEGDIVERYMERWSLVEDEGAIDVEASIIDSPSYELDYEEGEKPNEKPTKRKYNF
ncbi:ATP-dependent helicase [bacterium]|jgi:DNA helicase II / ATP-dependent DNA helicase PcrA|nr:ATP-dependent helicase [bacterium]